MYTHDRVISNMLCGLENHYPKIAWIIRSAATKGILINKGVLLVGHTPEIAPESYCHIIYPPLGQNLLEKKLLALDCLPDSIKKIYLFMNGATFYWGNFELWGFRTSEDHYINPAYDLLEENVKSNGTHIGIGSNSCGDTLVLNIVSGSIQLVPREPDLEIASFANLDDFFLYMKELNNE